MKKLLVKVGILLAIGLILLVVAGVFLFGPTSRAVIEKGTTYALGVETSLGRVDAGLGVDSSHLGIVEFDVQNPEGMQGDPFLAVGELGVSLRTMTVLSQTVQVPSILLDGLHLRLVQDGKRSNFGEILQHVRSLGAGAPSDADAPADEPAPEADASGGGGPMLMVDTIDLRGIQLTVDVTGIPGVEVHETFTAPDLHLDVAGTVEKAGGMSVGHLTGYVIDELIAHGIEEAGGHVSPQVLQVLKAGLDGGLEGLQDQVEAMAQEELDKLEAKAEEELDELEQKADEEVKKGQDKARAKLDELLKEKDDKVDGALKDLFGDG